MKTTNSLTQMQQCRKVKTFLSNNQKREKLKIMKNKTFPPRSHELEMEN